MFFVGDGQIQSVESLIVMPLALKLKNRKKFDERLRRCFLPFQR